MPVDNYLVFYILNHEENVVAIIRVMYGGRDVDRHLNRDLEVRKEAKMKILPITASKEEIKKLVIEWNELLAQEKYKEALEMFLIDESNVWTPELLESAVYGYGCPGYTKEEAEKEFGSADYKVTSIFNNPDCDKIIESIDISSAYKWVGENDIAVIHYDNIPLNGTMSDLTAKFFVRKVNDNEITLVFIDLHVM